MARRFFAEHVTDELHAQWEEDGQVSRELWRAAGEHGLLGVTMPEEYGGVGVDVKYSAVLWEEQAYTGHMGPGFSLHSEIVMPYILHYGTDEQKERILPKLASGEWIGAIAMTEPGAGSDLQGIRTSAIKGADGAYCVLLMPPTKYGGRKVSGGVGFADDRRQCVFGISRRLHAQRLQDVHHQRLDGRRDHRRRAHGPGRQERRARHVVAARRNRHGRLRAREEAQENRAESAGHQRAVLQRRQGARGQPAWRGEQGHVLLLLAYCCSCRRWPRTD